MSDTSDYSYSTLSKIKTQSAGDAEVETPIHSDNAQFETLEHLYWFPDLPQEDWVYKDRLETPPDNPIVRAYRRYGMQYPQVSARLQADPDLATMADGCGHWIGVENNGMQWGGCAFLRISSDGTSVNGWLRVAGGNRGAKIEVTSLLPSGVFSNRALFTIKVSRNMVELYGGDTINTGVGNLIAVVVTTPNVPQLADRSLFKIENTEPYAVAVAPVVLPRWMAPMFENNNPDSGQSLVAKIQESERYCSPLRVMSGDPKPARVFRFWEENTGSLLTSGTYDAGVTSHPFPLFGYDRRSFIFQADTDSITDGVKLQVLTATGNWRNIKVWTYSADDKLTYDMLANHLLGRWKYVPSASGASIREAQVNLR